MLYIPGCQKTICKTTNKNDLLLVVASFECNLQMMSIKGFNRNYLVKKSTNIFFSSTYIERGNLKIQNLSDC